MKVPVVAKKLLNLDIFKTTGKLKIFEPKKSHHFVDRNEFRILKMYTFLTFQIVFHKIIEENWKTFSAVKSSFT